MENVPELQTVALPGPQPGDTSSVDGGKTLDSRAVPPTPTSRRLADVTNKAAPGSPSSDHATTETPPKTATPTAPSSDHATTLSTTEIPPKTATPTAPKRSAKSTKTKHDALFMPPRRPSAQPPVREKVKKWGIGPKTPINVLFAVGRGRQKPEEMEERLTLDELMQQSTGIGGRLVARYEPADLKRRRQDSEEIPDETAKRARSSQ